ncbi:MAG: hypothetical protein ABSF45_08530 [Terriglobia bacterium]
MARIRKAFVQKLVSHINRKNWWHVPPLDPRAYQKRGKFLASSFGEAEFYGRPLDEPQRVKIANPLIGDDETICLSLFGKVISVPEPERRSFLTERLALDAGMKKSALDLGYDSILLMTPKGFANYRATGEIPRSLELNILEP